MAWRIVNKETKYMIPEKFGEREIAVKFLRNYHSDQEIKEQFDIIEQKSKQVTCDLINKCRLCGRKSDLQTGNIYLEEMEDLINRAIRENENQPLKGVRSGFIVQLMGTHRCKDGSLGITDLIGVKFKEE